MILTPLRLKYENIQQCILGMVLLCTDPGRVAQGIISHYKIIRFNQQFKILGQVLEYMFGFLSGTNRGEGGLSLRSWFPVSANYLDFVTWCMYFNFTM